MRDAIKEFMPVTEFREPSEGLYLARYVLCRPSPNSYAIQMTELVDGPHSDEQGVADAYELCRRFGFIKEGSYVMVRVESLPNLKPKINEEAAGACVKMLSHARR